MDNIHAVKFFHPVGKSTCAQGVTIPLVAQNDRMKSIQMGEKVPVTILFEGLAPVAAVIRRINNARGHLQFRYGNKTQDELREALSDLFDGGASGNLLEIEENEPFTFRFTPVLKSSSPSLHVSKYLYHQINKPEVERYTEVKQLSAMISEVKYDPTHNQAAYNSQIKDRLVSVGWNIESKVVDALGLKCDFEKNGVWLEVEFGNARSYYQDYVKFMLARKYRAARLGLLLSPMTSFANMLCEIGRQRAERNGAGKGGAIYSGMMDFEKAAREMPYLGTIFDMPIVVAGIGVKGSAITS